MLDFAKLAPFYHDALHQHLVPFALKYGRDQAGGGYAAALSETGEPIQADKSVAEQAQQVWAFAWLYRHSEPNPDWLIYAQQGAAFLLTHARDAHGRAHGTLDRRGQPLDAATNAHTELWLARAFGELCRSTGSLEEAEAARQALTSALDRRRPTRKGNDKPDGYRTHRHLNEPLTLLTTMPAMNDLIPLERARKTTDAVRVELLDEFMDKRAEVLRQTILPDGSFCPSPAGRRINTAMSLEAWWHLLDYASRSRNDKLLKQLIVNCLTTVERAWDERAGGLRRAIDYRHLPTLLPADDDKTALTHLHALAALLRAHQLGGSDEHLRWFKRVHDYTFQHFPDARHGGWYPLLDRHGRPHLTAKLLPDHGFAELLPLLVIIRQALIQPDSVPAAPTATAIPKPGNSEWRIRRLLR